MHYGNNSLRLIALVVRNQSVFCDYTGGNDHQQLILGSILVEMVQQHHGGKLPRLVFLTALSILGSRGGATYV